MASIIAWLDTSSEEQRRVRELIALFAQNESRDELGIGQIRDAFSNTLFPGTSVIQTRARYFLFVPWIYREGMRRGRSGQQLKAWADVRERRLIEALRDTGDVEGLIGRLAGPAVKVLPSAIYWSGLVRYGILTRDTAADQMLAPATGAMAEADELAMRIAGDWNPTLPPSPDGFPDRVDGGFELLPGEAVWLAEQITKTAEDTLLAHLLAARSMPDPESPAPWADSACATAPAHIRGQLAHAQLFSLCMHGAALLYNLLIGERYEAAGHTRVDDPVADYRERLSLWAEECAHVSPQLTSWDRQHMWDLVLRANPRLGLATRLFVDTWLDAVVTGPRTGVADQNRLRDLVFTREQKQKKAQSRLTNQRLLRTWSGESGSAQLTYRWPQVRRIVTDIREGASRDARS